MYMATAVLVLLTPYIKMILISSMLQGSYTCFKWEHWYQIVTQYLQTSWGMILQSESGSGDKVFFLVCNLNTRPCLWHIYLRTSVRSAPGKWGQKNIATHSMLHVYREAACDFLLTLNCQVQCLFVFLKFINPKWKKEALTSSSYSITSSNSFFPC